MKIRLLMGALPPPKHALIVCAGTVTCPTVEHMGRGFLMFKQYFDENHHSDTKNSKGWILDLNQKLTRYQSGDKLPLYCRIAQQGTYIGGVATVASLREGGPYTPTHQKMEQRDLEEQYKEAVRLAIQDAIQLRRPLYIQPLGIGAYKWNPNLAAMLFGEVLAEFKTTDIEIAVPIFDQAENSNDRQFAAQLQTYIDQGLDHKLLSNARLTASAAPTIDLNRQLLLLKSLAQLSGILSAALIFSTALAVLSVITTAPLTTAILGVTGLGLGVASCLLFRNAKMMPDRTENTELLAANRL